MRTSMNLPDALLERARERAASEHRTVTSLVEEALRQLLDKATSAPLEPLPTFGAEGDYVIDLDDKDALQALLDEEDFGDLYGQKPVAGDSA